jgi:Zn-dependent protease with chaperone function
VSALEARGLYYDGRTSAPRPALLKVDGAGQATQLTIGLADGELRVPLSRNALGERVGDTHRHLELPDGGSIEVLDNAQFDAALDRAGLTTAEAPLRRLEGRWRYALLALLATLLATLGFVRYGAPALAARAVRFLPPGVDALLGADSLRLLDKGVFKPSALPAQRQAQLRQVFSEVAAGAAPDSFGYRLELRAGGRLGANAFALPAGIVVLTDELAQLAQNDDELRGVFAHEVGHLVNRHAMRMLVQSSAAALLLMGIFGDVSGTTSLAAAAPAALVDAAYSRDFEREADAFAFRWMSAHRVPPQRLGDLLERLAAGHGEDAGGFLASHPDLKERVRALRPP